MRSISAKCCTCIFGKQLHVLFFEEKQRVLPCCYQGNATLQSAMAVDQTRGLKLRSKHKVRMVPAGGAGFCQAAVRLGVHLVPEPGHGPGPRPEPRLGPGPSLGPLRPWSAPGAGPEPVVPGLPLCLRLGAVALGLTLGLGLH